MEQGTNGAELHTSTEIKDVDIEHNGKIWRFQVKELSWKDQMELGEIMQDQQTNARLGITTTTTKYWRYLTQVYLKCVVSAPEGFRFDKCSMEFGEKLINAMPGIGQLGTPEDLTDAEAKN